MLTPPITFLNEHLYVVLNDDLEWSRGKRAAHAAHAWLAARGINYTHAIRVLNVKPRELENVEAVVPDTDHRYGVSYDEASDALIVYIAARKSYTRDATAILAVNAVAYWYTGYVLSGVTITSGNSDDVLAMPNIVRDQGRTEIPAGSVTAGSRIGAALSRL